MLTVLIAVGSVIFYVIAYNTYGRWLARKIFRLDPDARTPAEALRDNIDFVPSMKQVVFGHHFTSIAGTGPIVGPAIAVIWGWLPALVWVLIGSVFMGAVHDFGALVMSLRNRGFSIGLLTGFVIGRRARVLFLAIVFFALWIVLAIFGLVIASIFAIYPQSVLPVWLQLPIAVALGVHIARARSFRSILIASCVAVVLMYATIALGSVAPVSIGKFMGRPATFWWSILLFIYAFVASVLPVQVLLQPRDFINSYQLFIAMGMLMLGIFVAHPPMVAPPVQMEFVGADSHPFLPFLFITVACGAISGFHSLVGSGTTSKQLARETDALPVGYGSMLLEGLLAVLVILAICGGLGMRYECRFRLPGSRLAKLTAPQRALAIRSAKGLEKPTRAHKRTQPAPPARPGPLSGLPKGISGPLSAMRGFRERNPAAPAAIARTEAGDHIFSARLLGREAWREHYRSWDAAGGLGPKLRAFVDGAANLMTSYGVPLALGLAIMGVFVASFAGTTLDTATRLQRYVVSELGSAAGIGFLENRYVATAVAVITAAVLALWDGMGAGAMILWPLFGALNQLLASLCLLVLSIYLYRHKKPTFIVALPFAFMLVITAWAMTINLRVFLARGQWALLTITVIVLVLQFWMVIEAAVIWRRLREERSQEQRRG